MDCEKCLAERNPIQRRYCSQCKKIRLYPAMALQDRDNDERCGEWKHPPCRTCNKRSTTIWAANKYDNRKYECDSVVWPLCVIFARIDETVEKTHNHRKTKEKREEVSRKTSKSQELLDKFGQYFILGIFGENCTAFRPKNYGAQLASISSFTSELLHFLLFS